MDKCLKLLLKAQRSPSSVKLKEFIYLAKCFGFEYVHTRGSHHKFKRPGTRIGVNVQVDGKSVKKPQVVDFLKMFGSSGRFKREQEAGSNGKQNKKVQRRS